MLRMSVRDWCVSVLAGCLGAAFLTAASAVYAIANNYLYPWASLVDARVVFVTDDVPVVVGKFTITREAITGHFRSEIFELGPGGERRSICRGRRYYPFMTVNDVIFGPIALERFMGNLVGDQHQCLPFLVPGGRYLMTITLCRAADVDNSCAAGIYLHDFEFSVPRDWFPPAVGSLIR